MGNGTVLDASIIQKLVDLFGEIVTTYAPGVLEAIARAIGLI